MTMVAAGSAVHATRALSSLYTGDLLDVICVPVTLPVPEIVDRLNALQPVLLQGYPAALDALAREQQAGRLHIAPRGVTASSEQPTPEVRARIHAAFGLPVVNQFGSTEGVVGVSAPDDDVIVLASDLAVVEVVDEDLRPVPPDGTGAAVLVTSLMNPVQPLIRYMLSDRLVVQPPVAGSGHLRVTVQSREDELLTYGGVVVHRRCWAACSSGRRRSSRTRCARRPAGADVDVVAPSGADAEALAGRLTGALERAGLPAPRVGVRRVDGIARDPRTGKSARCPLPRPSDSGLPVACR